MRTVRARIEPATGTLHYVEGDVPAGRIAIVDEARSWIGTPYVLRGQLKGVGCDCATLLYKILRNMELIPEEKIGVFGQDWWAHASEDTYKVRMLRHASKVAEAVCSRSLNPEPGNVILCKTAGSHFYNHGAIVTMWPRGIHAVVPAVIEVDLTRDPLWHSKQVVILDPFNPPEVA